MMRRIPVLVAATVLALASCSSDAKAPATTITSSSTSATSTVVTASSRESDETLVSTSTSMSTPTSTSLPSTTAEVSVAPTTTSSQTSSSSTAPTETTSPFGPEETAVRLAIQDYFVAYEACGQVPASCDPSLFLAREGSARAVITKLISALDNSGDYFGADLRGSRVIAEKVVFDSNNKATITSCWFDAGQLLGPDGPDGKPTVINDAISSNTLVHVLYFESGRWLVGQEDRIAQLGEGDQCPVWS
jgi:hypothetical protein